MMDIKQVRKINKHGPRFNTSQIVRAEFLIKQHKYNEALKCYKEVLEDNPYRSRAWKDMGYCYRMLREYDKALEAYKKVLEGNDRILSANAHIGMGRIYEDLGNDEEALRSFDKALKLYRRNCDACMGIARIYSRSGEKENALYWATEAVEANARNWRALLLLAHLYYDTDQLEKAKDTYQKVLIIDPNIRAAASGIKNIESRNKS